MRQPKCLHTLPDIPWRAKSVLVEDHCLHAPYPSGKLNCSSALAIQPVGFPWLWLNYHLDLSLPTAYPFVKIMLRGSFQWLHPLFCSSIRCQEATSGSWPCAHCTEDNRQELRWVGLDSQGGKLYVSRGGQGGLRHRGACATKGQKPAPLYHWLCCNHTEWRPPIIKSWSHHLKQWPSFFLKSNKFWFLNKN